MYRIASPSGDQFGKLLIERFAVAARASLPSAFITKISLLPLRSDTNAISVLDTPRVPRNASTTSSASRRAVASRFAPLCW